MKRNALTFPPNSFLGSLSDQSWEEFCAVWTQTKVTAGSQLIKFQDENRDVFFVLSGQVRATVYTPAGREVSFLTISHGECIGEFSAIDEAPRSSDAVAATDCIIARLSADRFRRLVRSNSEISFHLMTVLVGHLRRLSQRVVDFNAKSADQRLRDMLLELAQKNECDGTALIESPPTQAQLAAIIFSSRESVAREMGRLRNAGVLGRKKRALFFPNVVAFETHINSLSSDS